MEDIYRLGFALGLFAWAISSAIISVGPRDRHTAIMIQCGTSIFFGLLILAVGAYHLDK